MKKPVISTIAVLGLFIASLFFVPKIVKANTYFDCAYVTVTHIVQGVYISCATYVPPTPAPTHSPTPAPTSSPTAKPTSTPTPAPTPTHTPASTPSPTAAPTTAGTVFENAILADSPYLYAPLHETSGTTATDLGSGGNNLTYVGAGLLGQLGLDGDGGAYSYTPNGGSNGAANYVVSNISPSNYPTSATALTWEALYKPSALDLSASYIGNYLISNRDSTSASTYWFLKVQGGATPGQGYVIAQNGSGASGQTADGTILAGQTYDIAFSYDQSNNNIIIYINGVVSNTHGLGFTNTVYGSAAVPFFVGTIGTATNSTTGASSSVTGLISDVALYTSALSSTRIAAHYAAIGVAPTPAPTPTPVPTASPLAVAAPATVNGSAVSLAPEAALCVAGTEYTNFLPLIPAGYGLASGHYMGEFDQPGYTRSLLDTFWGSGSVRVGTIGSSITATSETLAAPVVIPDEDGSVSITVTQASPSGITNGSLIEVGRSPGFDSNGINTFDDPTVIIGTLASGYGTTTWNLTGVRPYTSGLPHATADVGFTIPTISPSYGTNTKIYTVVYGPWGGYQESFGRVNGGYTSYNGDPSDGTGLPDPFAITNDTDAVGSPQGLKITARPVPASLSYPNESPIMGHYGVTTTSASVTWPAEGGSVSVPINPVPYQNDFTVALGAIGSGKVAVGFVSSGAYICDHTTGAPCTVVNGPWVISGIHYMEGSQSTGSATAPAGTQLVSVGWQPFYAGALDKELDFGYGYLTAQIKFPASQAGNSFAFWSLQSQAGITPTGLARNEDDIAEQFAGGNSKHGLNAGNLLWNANGTNVEAFWQGDGSYDNGGSYGWPAADGVNYPDVSYHEYGSSWIPGGSPAFPTDFGANKSIVRGDFSPSAGDSFFLDNTTLAGHTGTTDLTQGVIGKEVIAVFQTEGGGNTTATTTTGSFTIGAPYASLITVPVANTSNWIQSNGTTFNIVSTDGTIHARAHLVGESTNSISFYLEADQTAPVNSVGSVMPSGSYVQVQDAFTKSWPQSAWVSHIRAYKPTTKTCTPGASPTPGPIHI